VGRSKRRVRIERGPMVVRKGGGRYEKQASRVQTDRNEHCGLDG
jgi:hypothetical protein